jgi:pimeloyl-ACP methyl ester carboxylesterase
MVYFLQQSRRISRDFRFFSVMREFNSCEPIHIVFFPGTGCDKSLFQRITHQFLSQKVSDQYVYTNHGGTLIDISKKCVTDLRISLKGKKAIAVGHSLGGITAGMVVDAAPELFCGLVLCNTRFKLPNPLECRAKNATIKKISKLTDEEFDKLVGPEFFKSQEKSLTEEELNLLIESVRSNGRQNYLQQIRLSLETNTPNYQRILDHLPMMVVQGMDDSVIRESSWDESGLLGAITRYNLELIKCSGGHLSILKHPELIASCIKNIITVENNSNNSCLSA